mmetsp:Transcript_34351/g.86214  ORF Transcript_34351/g.86214 Transcript_34351/m.86214 type:complete len:87 (-) Transcript_34351:158-418(-)
MVEVYDKMRNRREKPCTLNAFSKIMCPVSESTRQRSSQGNTSSSAGGSEKKRKKSVTSLMEGCESISNTISRKGGLRRDGSTTDVS